MKKTYRNTAVTFAICMLGLFVSSGAGAAMVTTDQLVNQVNSQMNRDLLISALDREDVQRVLKAKGVTVDIAKARVNAMTDQEIASLQGDIDELPAGAGPGSVLVAVVLVFVILDIIGVTNVFTFIR